MNDATAGVFGPPLPQPPLAGTVPPAGATVQAAHTVDATIDGERHVSAVAGRGPRLSKKGGLGLLLGAGALAVAFVSVHGSGAQSIKSGSADKLEVKSAIRYEVPPDLPAPVPASLTTTASAADAAAAGYAPTLPDDPMQSSFARPTAKAQQVSDRSSSASKPADRLLVYTAGNGGDERAAGGAGGGSPAVLSGAGEPGAGGADELGAHLQLTKLTGVSANLLHHQPYLLTTGNVVPCILQTAMDSTLPGLVTCIIPQDILGKTGLTLLDRGTRIVGEFQGGVKQGQSRVFVLWTRAETPQGVVINLDSPASDPLGRSGLSGAVDNHFWARFGGALLLTVVDGAIKAGVAAASSSGTSNIQTGDTESVLAETLRNSANIPPTIRKNQGELVSIFVARDLDFSSVYRVQPTGRADLAGATLSQ